MFLLICHQIHVVMIYISVFVDPLVHFSFSLSSYLYASSIQIHIHLPHCVFEVF